MTKSAGNMRPIIVAVALLLPATVFAASHSQAPSFLKAPRVCLDWTADGIAADLRMQTLKSILEDTRSFLKEADRLTGESRAGDTQAMHDLAKHFRRNRNLIEMWYYNAAMFGHETATVDLVYYYADELKSPYSGRSWLHVARPSYSLLWGRWTALPGRPE